MRHLEYGMQVLILVVGNTAFNSIFNLGSSILDEENWYKNTDSSNCIGPDCTADFLATGFYCLVCCVGVGVLMVMNDLFVK